MNDLKTTLEQLLGNFWDERAIPIDEPPTTTDELVAPLDSLAAVEVLSKIDPLVGFKVPIQEVIRKGGYDTRGQFIEQVTEKVLEHVKRQKP